MHMPLFVKGSLARRERRAYPHGSVRSEQRSQRAFHKQPFGRRAFCRKTLSLVGRRSVRICSLLASRLASKFLAAAYAKIYDVVFRFWIQNGLLAIGPQPVKCFWKNRYVVHNI